MRRSAVLKIDWKQNGRKEKLVRLKRHDMTQHAFRKMTKLPQRERIFCISSIECNLVSGQHQRRGNSGFPTLHRPPNHDLGSAQLDMRMPPGVMSVCGRGLVDLALSWPIVSGATFESQQGVPNELFLDVSVCLCDLPCPHDLNDHSRLMATIPIFEKPTAQSTPV